MIYPSKSLYFHQDIHLFGKTYIGLTFDDIDSILEWISTKHNGGKI